jgi:DNA-binding transcriptional MerR regulator
MSEARGHCMRIGELAKKTRTSVRSLRYYEQQGLLVSRRSSSGQRLYDASDIDRVVQIVGLLRAGLGTTKIAELLPCLTAPPAQRTGHLLTSLRAERDRLDNDIASLRVVRQELDRIITTITHQRPDKATRR